MAERYRSKRQVPGSHRYGDDYGTFEVPSPVDNRPLFIIACAGDWEHVSVSRKNRVPNWREMCFVKDMFWGEDEAVMQLHPAKSEYVNDHPHCLHLWRPADGSLPLPPRWMV